MKNRKRDDVLYLTLIDFFLQIIFLVMISLMAFIFLQNKWVDLAKKYQLKDDGELYDRLEEANIKNFKDAMHALKYIEMHGGIKKIEEAVQKMEKGQGKRPCVTISPDSNIAKSIASFVLYDQKIVLTSWQPEFEILANEKKIELTANMSWPVKRFYASWSHVIQNHDDCRYTVTAYERSQFVAPRDHLQSVFYVQIRR
jgi:hypothetical protein